MMLGAALAVLVGVLAYAAFFHDYRDGGLRLLPALGSLLRTDRGAAHAALHGVEHRHRDIVGAESPHGGLEVEWMEHTLVKLDVVVPQVAVNNTEVRPINCRVGILYVLVHTLKQPACSSINHIHDV